ncbi:unnamed protein product [Cuscuta campestris]|uniref:RING-type E3 ubiquitin transferase n=1 Tax=Cuscuta campestris TaxID=132261 RepID=A0A484N9V1_9ASTE|nr:unnamed protein product [Cuscuta campestris]
MASSGSVGLRYEVKCDFVQQKNLISPSSSSSSVVFTVQSTLRLGVAGGNPLTEFLEEKGWRETRQSSLELPWSTDEGLIIDDDHNLKISETLTLLRVPKSYHQLIIRRVPPQSVGALHLVGVAPKLLVHLFEVTHLTLPLIDEHGRAICPESKRDYAVMNYGLQTEEEEFDQAKFVDSLKKLIVVAGGVDEEEEESGYIDNWCWDLIDAIKRLAWPVTKKAIVVYDKEDKQTCPICLEVMLELDKPWSEMPCCSKAFHRDCISIWTAERVKNCPWCRSSLPLVVQSAKGLIRRLNSEHFVCPSRPEFHDLLLILWHLLSERVWWTCQVVHEAGCNCGCQTANIDMIRA